MPPYMFFLGALRQVGICGTTWSVSIPPAASRPRRQGAGLGVAARFHRCGTKITDALVAEDQAIKPEPREVCHEFRRSHHY